jgi:hypothetical protein
MHKQLSLIFATVALSAVAFAQVQDTTYQVGYAANLNIGDAVVNLSNDGAQGGFVNAAPFKTEGNICVNVYTFDPAEEEIACCACLVTPNGLNALSAKADLISNPLTPAIPTSIVVKLLASEPGIDKTGAFTLCNPSVVGGGTAVAPFYYPGPGLPAHDTNLGFLVNNGMLAWGATLEPASTPGTYSPVAVPFLQGTLSGSELTALATTCNFIQSDGSGFGICKSCQTGALSGTKQ